MAKIMVKARPRDFVFEPKSAALIIIDMQNDFVKPGGMGDLKGLSLAGVKSTIQPLASALVGARAAGLKIVFTRQGYARDLSDYPFRGRAMGRRGDAGTKGPLGLVLVRGEKGFQIIDELQPAKGEVVIDKLGHSAFYRTKLGPLLKKWRVRYPIITGVTTDVCVNSTVREASDRGYESLVLEDCVGCYNPRLQIAGLEMIAGQSGIFGQVSTSKDFVKAIARIGRTRTKQAHSQS